ncbi:MAG: low molecular weight protein arginine phosphatase [Candidatus Omnitrophica bacterium]|nr:low molecular weight protein arginine phosphatase [Candidatus Omnitrophota bacterium]
MINSVLFVCTGNSCRSVMAEGLMRKRLRELGKENISISSAGTSTLDGLSPTDGTIMVMKEEGIDVSGHRSRSLTADMIKKAGLILTMEESHKDEVLRIFPAVAKTHVLKKYENTDEGGSAAQGIRDPIGGSIETYRAIKDEIKREIERFVKKL